jgi:hypothetical protein
MTSATKESSSSTTTGKSEKNDDADGEDEVSNKN